MSAAPAFASVGEALEMVRAGLGYLAAADAAQLPAAVQAQVLRELEQHDAMATAARAWFLAAFTAGQGHAVPVGAQAPQGPRVGRVGGQQALRLVGVHAQRADRVHLLG